MAYLKNNLVRMYDQYKNAHSKYLELEDMITELEKHKRAVFNDRDLTENGRRNKVIEIDHKIADVNHQMMTLQKETLKTWTDERENIHNLYGSQFRVTSGNVDNNTIALLREGVLSADEMRQLAMENSNNPAMSRIISKYASEQYKSTKDPHYISAKSIADQSGTPKHLEITNGLIEVMGYGLGTRKRSATDRVSARTYEPLVEQAFNNAIDNAGDINTD